MTPRIALVISFAVVAICFANALPNDFVFDDGAIVASNPAIRTISPMNFLKSSYWSDQQQEGIYRPFTVFTLSVDYAIWKRWAAGFRLTNLAIHALNGFLVFILCASLAGEGLVPLVAMLIYLAHPVQNEAVTSIVGRGELFSAFFFLSAWLLFRRGHTALPAVLFFLALLSKENAIVLPAVLLLDAWLTRQKLALGRLSVVAGIAGAYLLLRFWVLGAVGIPVSAQYMAGRLTFIERFMTSGRVFLEYLRLLVFPMNIAGDYDFNAIPIAHLTSVDAWLGLFLIAAIVVSAIFYTRRNALASMGILFAFVVFLPASNWIMPISVLMAERFLYLPLIGLSITAALLYNGIHHAGAKRLVGVGCLLFAIVLSNSHDYIRRNDFTFFANMVRVVPDSAKARLGYGYALWQAGRKDEAAAQLEAGLRILPNHPEMITTLALTKTTSKDCTQAWPLFERALQIDPTHADTHRRMGDCYFKEGKMQEAESMYRVALESIPFPDSMLYFMWGRSLEQTGKATAAIAAYERGELIDPGNRLIQEKLASMRKEQSSRF